MRGDSRRVECELWQGRVGYEHNEGYGMNMCLCSVMQMYGLSYPTLSPTLLNFLQFLPNPPLPLSGRLSVRLDIVCICM